MTIGHDDRQRQPRERGGRPDVSLGSVLSVKSAARVYDLVAFVHFGDDVSLESVSSVKSVARL
jgi:hypothetical protein